MANARGTAAAISGSDPARASEYTHVSTTKTWDGGVDLLAVERVVNNDLPIPQLTEAEQELAARLMTREGFGSAEIAGRIGVENRTITRWRKQWRGNGQ